MTSKIRIKTLDQKIFEIEWDIARCSKTISMMMDICFDRNVEAHNVVIPFRDWVHSKEFNLVLNWLQHHHMQSKTPCCNIETAGGDATGETDIPEVITEKVHCDKGGGEAGNGSVDHPANSWDATFIEAMDQSTLMDFIVTVNYLNVTDLLEFLYKIITDMVPDKTYEEVCKACSPKQQLTADEIEYLYNENPCLLLEQCEEEDTFLALDDDFELTPEVEDEYFAGDDFSAEEFQCSSGSSERTDDANESKKLLLAAFEANKEKKD